MATLVRMGTSVLSLRIDGELLERLRHHAAKRGMSVQDYVVRTLIRDDFDERSRPPSRRRRSSTVSRDAGTPYGIGQVRPRAGIR